MTAYTAIADSDIDPDSPLTTSLLTLMRDNPIAITEKASGAPVLATDYIVNDMLADDCVDIDDQLLVENTTLTSSSITSSSQYTLPKGVYIMGASTVVSGSGHTAQLQVNTNGGWVTTASHAVPGTFADIPVISDGVNIRFNCSSGDSYNVKLRKIY